MSFRPGAVATLGQIRTILASIKATMDGLAGYIPDKVSVTLPVASWTQDLTNEDYPYYQDVTVTGITANDRADVVFAESVMDAVEENGVCSIVTTSAGSIRVRAVTVPEEALTATVWIIYAK